MANDDVKKDQLKEHLRRAYFEKEKQVVGSRWQAQVMRRIRQAEPLGSIENFSRLFEAFVWRLSPVFGVLIICAVVGLMQLDFMPDAGIQQLLSYSVEDYDLSQFIVL